METGIFSVSLLFARKCGLESVEKSGREGRNKDRDIRQMMIAKNKARKIYEKFSFQNTLSNV